MQPLSPFFESFLFLAGAEDSAEKTSKLRLNEQEA
jgi:hypothetical protein